MKKYIIHAVAYRNQDCYYWCDDFEFIRDRKWAREFTDIEEAEKRLKRIEKWKGSLTHYYSLPKCDLFNYKDGLYIYPDSFEIISFYG